MKRKKPSRGTSGNIRSFNNLPTFCDFTCTHADFPPADAVGACRREQAVFCTLLKKFNNRNNKCIARK